MSQWLLIDSGNTRIKTALADPADPATLRAAVALEQSRRNELSAQLPPASPQRAFGVNVAGDEASAQVAAQVAARYSIGVEWIAASARRAGVRNAYARAEALGADRWAALIAAHRRLPADDVLVASFGTATTLDAVTRDGEFPGGLILPGLDLMLAALARATAQLPLAAGSSQPFPTATEDAITSGCLTAQAGALLRQVERLRERTGRAPRVLLTGGAAARVAGELAALSLPFEIADNLVLEGVLHAALAPAE